MHRANTEQSITDVSPALYIASLSYFLFCFYMDYHNIVVIKVGDA